MSMRIKVVEALGELISIIHLEDENQTVYETDSGNFLVDPRLVTVEELKAILFIMGGGHEINK